MSQFRKLYFLKILFKKKQASPTPPWEKGGNGFCRLKEMGYKELEINWQD